MTRARHAAFGAATALSCVAVLAAPARASSVAIKVDGVAWWSRQPGAAAQPAGGFQLAYGVDGAESEAAMRVTVPQVSGLKATLVLAESSSSIAASDAAARVCTTTATWPAANPGPYAQAPKADCTHTATLKRGTGQWTADVTTLLTPGATSNLVIEPVAGRSPTYTVTITKASVSGQGTAAPADTVPVSTPPAAGAAAVPTATTTTEAPTPGAAAAPLPSPTPTTTSPPTAAQPQGSGIIASPTFTPNITHHHRPWGRLILFVPVAAALGFGAASLRRRRTLAGWTT